MTRLGAAARVASAAMAAAGTAAKDRALRSLAARLRDNVAALQLANARDLDAAREAGLAAPLVDRLKLTRDIVETVAQGCEQIAAMADPVGEITGVRRRPSGISVGQMRVPLGVFGMIYESRPNVTIEAASLAIKSGNAAILRGGSEALHSNLALWRLVQAALLEAGLPAAGVQLVETTDRAAVGHLIAMPEAVDVIIPRGGKGLIERISGRSEGAGDQAPGRQLPCLCRRRGRPRDGAEGHRQRQDAEGTAPATPPSRCSCMRRRQLPSCRASAPSSPPRAWRCAAAPPASPCCSAVPGAKVVAATAADWDDRVPGGDHQHQGRRLARRGHRPRQPPRLAPHRRDPDDEPPCTRCASCARSIRPA